MEALLLRLTSLLVDTMELNVQFSNQNRLLNFLNGIAVRNHLTYVVDEGGIVEVLGPGIDLFLRQNPDGSVAYFDGSKWVSLADEADLLRLLGIEEQKKEQKPGDDWRSESPYSRPMERRALPPIHPTRSGSPTRRT